ncbi:N-acetylglucosamine-6-phosphate deacetylase [Ruegeria sp.]|uniref:N-acetylglucosamine-6-phosphate deacetylase n=1 Tax=Ruegeria sp. TaxID=1879320 RepID=UPI00231228B5|nr:N-acetylglucosamine-6-phosphate deacetylase [Ruegeria sp.]MDA7963481.1 N-acetylglucosamine-6-phosphate deacetylase [Ruegeria sp.]
MRYLHPKALFDGQKLLNHAVLAIEDDIVVEIVPISAIPSDTSVEHLNSLITPGLFDIQVNGGGGVMLNNAPTRDGVRRIAQTHNALGTAYLLPTVITDRPEIMEKAAQAVAAELGQNGVLGIHIEGPHINPTHKGTHDPAFIRPFDDKTMSVLEQLRQEQVPVLLTLAPETVEPGLIARLTAMGIVVSAGHSAATAEETRRALSEGLRCFTHLFNGMPPMTSRAPMITGAAINSAVWCGIIADGHHVDDDMIALATRARPVPHRMILVSDAMSTVGGPDQFDLYGETIRVQDGRLVNAQGSLAGAHITLAGAVTRMIHNVGIPISDAARMATTNPFDMMQLKRPEMTGQTVGTLGHISF